MKITTLALVLMLTAWGAGAQTSDNIRAPDIDSETPEGQLLTQAGLSEDPLQKTNILETFVERHSDHKYIGYVYLQLQTLYLEQEKYDKSVEYGQKLLEIVPGDIEVRHNLNKALLGMQNWDTLLPALKETKASAEKVASQPKPGDPDEAEAWQTQVDYAQGVLNYTDWALNAGITQIADPATKIEWMDTLRELYPESQYLDGIHDRYAIAYQQMGDMENMTGAMKAAVQAGSENESYYYALAEDALSKNNFEQVTQYGEKLIALLEQKQKPGNMSAEEWEKHKAKYTALARYVMGRSLVVQNKFREGRAQLLQTVDALKEEGGERYGVLAYFLGVCYVKLDIQGDNIQKATYWMNEAANTASPYTAEAKKTLDAIKARL